MPDPVPPIAPITPPSAPASLINTAPGAANTNPGTSPPGAAPGSPVTSYNPAAATATQAAGTGFEAKPFEVSPDAVVASRIRGIIDAGSPLMEQAEANARAALNSRGLINSTQAVTAGQKALYDVALPIATADAATYDRAATNTVNAQNRASEFGAAATNTADLTNAQLGTATSQFNAGQQNAALDKAAAASNTVALTAQTGELNKALTAQKGEIDKAIADLNANTQLSLADKAAASQKILADIQANTALSVADRQAATQQTIANLQANTQRSIADLQANTELTAQDKAAQAQQALANLNNTAQAQIARINADTSLSIAEKQAATQQIVAGMNNQTARDVQALQNAGSLANIRANGEVSTKLQVLGDQNKLLLQTNAGASQIYTQSLTNMSSIMTNPNLNPEQKTQALNNQVAQLTDALQAMTAISGTPGVSSLLQFTTAGNDQGGGSPAPVGTPPANNAAAQRTAEIQRLYGTILGRPADAAGLSYWAEQAAAGMPIDQIAASMRASDEARALAA